MRVLLIKTSSMGDVIHALPALTDASHAVPGIQFDWMVEDSFAEIPRWHTSVDKVIPIAFRRWRKGLLSWATYREWQAWRKQLRENAYDLVLDAQGLVKSAFLSYFAKGVRVGLDFRSAREPLASWAYQRKHTVNFYQHAVTRMRLLFSLALQYPLPTTAPDFGINKQAFITDHSEKYLVFLHSTTWESKLWPETYWMQLADIAASHGYRIKMSGGNAEELARAQRIAASSNVIDALPRLSIVDTAKLLANARGAVAVDTGFGHLAAALNIPTVSIYGSTNPVYTGAVGNLSTHLAATFSCAPCLARTCTYRQPSAVTPACYTEIPPVRVWSALSQFL